MQSFSVFVLLSLKGMAALPSHFPFGEAFVHFTQLMALMVLSATNAFENSVESIDEPV